MMMMMMMMMGRNLPEIRVLDPSFSVS
jgi:hypothetical protein